MLLDRARINDDGIADLAIGAPGVTTEAGEAYVVFGDPTLGGTIDVGTTSPDLIVRGIVKSALGFSAAAGDVNGDGIDDLLLGLPTFGGIFVGGFVAVIYGSASLGGIIEVTTNLPGEKADVLLQAPSAGDALGTAVAAGDFNGDGTKDITMGAAGADAGGVPCPQRSIRASGPAHVSNLH